MEIKENMYFDNVTIECYEYTEKDGEYDEDGEPEYEYVKIYVIPADMQPATNNEVVGENGEMLTDTYKIYIKNYYSITPSMKIKVKGENDTYSIVGTPLKYNHGIAEHIKIIVQKDRTPMSI